MQRKSINAQQCKATVNTRIIEPTGYKHVLVKIHINMYKHVSGSGNYSFLDRVGLFLTINKKTGLGGKASTSEGNIAQGNASEEYACLLPPNRIHKFYSHGHVTSEFILTLSL